MSGEEEKSRPPREAFRAPRSSKSLPDLIGAFAFGGKFSSRNCLLQGPFSVPMRYCKGKDPDLEPQGPAWWQGRPGPRGSTGPGPGAAREEGIRRWDLEQLLSLLPVPKSATGPEIGQGGGEYASETPCGRGLSGQDGSVSSCSLLAPAPHPQASWGRESHVTGGQGLW